MNKRIFYVFVFILIVFILGFFFYYNFRNKENSQNYHTCKFDNSSLVITCSSELRIKTGYIEVPTNQTMEESNSVICYYSGNCYYKRDEYSKNNSANLLEILPKDLIIVEKNDAFSNIYTYYYRIIRVKDIKSEKEFDFYVDETREYNIEEGNALLKYNKELCKSKKGGDLCMPEQHWRCEQGLDYTDGCYSIVYSISRNETTIDLCYELEYPTLVSYCLGRNDIQKCFEYSKTHPEIKNMCETIKCQEENMIESDPGVVTITNKCSDIYNS
ncbi:MAG: hypothetical protein WC867_03575 [Candidatus Pacearchaeota archaeon]|jgi:hypothetical protein